MLFCHTRLTVFPLETIGDSAFNNNEVVKTLKAPKTLTAINYQAFAFVCKVKQNNAFFNNGSQKVNFPPQIVLRSVADGLMN